MTTKAATILLAVLGVVMSALWVALAAVVVLAYILSCSTGSSPIELWKVLLTLGTTGLVPLGLFVAAAVSAVHEFSRQGRRL